MRDNPDLATASRRTHGSTPVRHLYVHIPFCPKVCPYCNFYKEASDRNKTQPFLEALLREADRWAAQLRPQTIFFGGGTPTALSPSQLDFLLTGLRERLDLSDLEEWTFEMNPATVSLEKARLLRRFGVNRVSMGVQAWQPHLLETLGRVHTAAQAERSFAILREAGFQRLNLDLIFGIPGQTPEEWRTSLQHTIALQPEHISAYCLTYEEDTPFFAQLAEGKFSRDEDIEADFFALTEAELSAAGYPPYEISNFAPPGQECRHNLAYWNGTDYLGLGPSAFSTVGTQRWRNIQNTVLYTSGTLAGSTPHDFSEHVPPALRERERLTFGLRTRFGLSPAQTSFLNPGKISRLLAQGLLEYVGQNLRLTSAGRLVADEIATHLWD